MATMTEAQIQSAWGNSVKILDETRKFGASNASNIISMLSTYQAAYGGDFIANAAASIAACRASVAGILTPSYIQSVIRPWLQQYGLSVLGLNALSGDSQLLNQLYLSLAQRKIYVQSRTITYGTPAITQSVSGGSSTGNGQIVRLTRDMWNQNIENIWCDQKLAQCVQDAQTGSKQGQEVFALQGSVPYVDQIKRSGSGLSTTLFARTTDDNNPGLFNASFDFFSSATGSPTNPNGITNWTSANGDNSTQYTFDNVNIFRVAPSVTTATSYSLNMVATNTVSQLLSAKGIRLNQSTPYLLAVIWNAQVNGATGTLQIQMGSVNNQVTVTGANGWNVTLCPGPIGQSAWPKQFGTANGNNSSISLTYNKTGGSGLLIGEVLFLQGQPHDNTWYWMIPATAATYIPWKFNDQLVWADVDGGTGKVQNFLWRAWNTYLPSSNGSSIGFPDV